ncbi:MAG TPA: HEAT repeat domain-containing protein [Pyrinomonadaceae bacterium]|jgi:hypothetical protein
MRTKLLVVLVAALALSALLLAGGASAQRAARQGNDNASGGSKSKRVVGVRSSDTGNGSRVTITADDSLKDYSAYRSGDRFYVVLPKSAAGARGGGSGRGYSDMQVQQRGDSVVLSYRVQPGAKPRVEQKFNRLDVVFDVPGDAGQQDAANNAARQQQQQQQQQTPPAENRNPAAQQNNRTESANSAPNANPTPERRQPTAEDAARAQAANAAAANTTPPVTAAGQPAAVVDPSAQNPATTSVEPAQGPSPAASPAAEPQVAQAQPPAAVAPITTKQPAAGTQTGNTLGTFLIRNWALALVFALIVVGLGLIFAARRAGAAAPAPVESLNEGSAAELEEPRASRAKEVTARALKDASAAAKASTVVKPEPAAATEPFGKSETVAAAEDSGADVRPLAAATALAGGAAASKSKKQSKKEARQESKRKKKGARVEEPARADVPAAESAAAEPVVQETLVEEHAVEEPSVEEQLVAAPVAEETAAVESAAEETVVREETLVETAPVEEAVRQEPAEVAQAVTTEEAAEVVAAPEAAEHFAAPAAETAEPAQFEVADPSFEEAAAPAFDTFDTAEVETTEIAPVEAEASEPFVAESEAPAPVTEIEPAFAPDPERILAETHSLLEGEQYDRAVVGSRDAMARQMIAAELLSALAGRNALKRERARAAFVEHGYFDETARDLREADAPAERSAAARSLAILGDRKATPLLVAALEDPVSDVRRAAVEALGALRDPSAVEPLEVLLEREKNERNRIPPRVIRTAVESCREGFEQTPAAATQAVIPAVEATEPAPSFEPAAEPAEEAARVVEALPAEEAATVEEAVVETAPEPFADIAEPKQAGETSITPFVDESFEAEPFVAPAAEATGETAHVPEPVHAEEAFETVAETGLEPFVETERPFVDFEEDAAGSSEEFAAGAAREVGIEPVVERDEGLSTAETFDTLTEERESGQATLFDSGADETTREIEPVAADSSKELTPSAGEWFDFDIGDMSGEAQPAASAPPPPEPAAHEHVFETSSGETLAAPAAAEVEEPAPFAEASAPATRDIEVAGEAAQAPPVSREPEPAHAAYEPAAETREKGLAPFDESSTVPAAIQQRIASRDPRERAVAIVELSHVDTDEAFQQICAAFDDPSQDVRSAAARALHELRADRAESFTRALREASPERRREIGAAIASSGLAGESISQLTGEGRERTYEAFSLLFLMAKAGEVQPLLRAIEGHPNNEVRLAVVKLLALSGQKEVLPAFRRLAVRGSLPTEVRSAVMEAIYQISSSQPTHA